MVVPSSGTTFTTLSVSFYLLFFMPFLQTHMVNTVKRHKPFSDIPSPQSHPKLFSLLMKAEKGRAYRMLSWKWPSLKNTVKSNNGVSTDMEVEDMWHCEFVFVNGPFTL